MSPQNLDNERKEGASNQKMPLKGLIVWLLLLALFVAMYNVLPQGREKYPDVSYIPEFVDFVENGEIKNCEIVVEVTGRHYIQGERSNDPETGRPRRFKAYFSGGVFRRGFCWSVPQEQVKRFLPRRSQARLRFHFLALAAPTSWRCSSASVHPGSGTCLNRERSTRPVSSSSTRSTRWAGAGSAGWAGAMTNGSRR